MTKRCIHYCIINREKTCSGASETFGRRVSKDNKSAYATTQNNAGPVTRSRTVKQLHQIGTKSGNGQTASGSTYHSQTSRRSQTRHSISSTSGTSTLQSSLKRCFFYLSNAYSGLSGCAIRVLQCFFLEFNFYLTSNL